MSARQIEPKFVPKIWGSTQLAPWFADVEDKIGEVWFPAGELLIKFLFTTENLSVQVHPGDDYAREHENSRGKTEMWYILRADADAQVALGFSAPLDLVAGARLYRSGEVMEHIAWHPARPGDTFFTPAGTVHAIGKGLALCEIQENSDVTYRVFDYGRPRDLHIDRALDVSEWTCHAGAAETRTIAPGVEELVRCGHFRTVRMHVTDPADLPGCQYAIVLEGSGTLGELPFQAGNVFDLGPENIRIEPATEALLLLTGSPQL